jgi:transcriptional regulator with XRE-family HTH domain
MKTMNEIFSRNLRNMLYAKNRTQVELAKAVKVSETSVSHWVNGDVVPRPKKVDEICAYLKCSREELTADHEQVAELAPEDVMAEELRNNPKLFRLMIYAMRLSPDRLDDLIKKAGELK